MKQRIIILTVTFFILLSGVTIFGSPNNLDDLERSFRDVERSMKYDSLKDLEFQRKYQLQQQNIKPLTQDLNLKDQPGSDKAVTKNQERFKKLMDDQKRSLAKNFEDWGLKIPKKYRLIIEIFAVALFISLFSTMYYRDKIKKQHEEKIEQAKQAKKKGPSEYEVEEY